MQKLIAIGPSFFFPLSMILLVIPLSPTSLPLPVAKRVAKAWNVGRTGAGGCGGLEQRHKHNALKRAREKERDRNIRLIGDGGLRGHNRDEVQHCRETLLFFFFFLVSNSYARKDHLLLHDEGFVGLVFGTWSAVVSVWPLHFVKECGPFPMLQVAEPQYMSRYAMSAMLWYVGGLAAYG